MTPLCVLILGAGLAADAADGRRISDSIVQIGVIQKAPSLVITPLGRFSAVDQKTGDTRALQDKEEYRVEPRSAEALDFGPFRFAGQVRLLPSGADDIVQVGPRSYRGSLVLRTDKDATLTVVHETGIEDYLFGVLPVEMSPEWPMEALKAQAVVARSFTVANLGKFQASGFDLSDDSRSQVYGGSDKEDARTTSAVQRTAGELLFWKGKRLKVFFHSCCGGHTSNIGAVWGSAESAQKPVRGVPDKYCKASPHSEWTAYFTNDDILAALHRHGYWGTKLKGIRLGKKDPSGFAKTLKFSLKGGTYEVRANDFRNWMGNTELKSTKIVRIVSRRKGHEFRGRGFGHGVGLCQWGARYQAEKGRTYKEILKYYFPGAEVRRGDDD